MPTKQFGLVLDDTWHDVIRNTLMENGPEKVSNVQKTTKEQQHDKEGSIEKIC